MGDNSGQNIYTGGFKNGKKSGKGTLTNDKVTFTGTFKYDKKHGSGKQTTNLTGETLSSVWNKDIHT